jgi:hypothetical protein
LKSFFSHEILFFFFVWSGPKKALDHICWSYVISTYVIIFTPNTHVFRLQSPKLKFHYHPSSLMPLFR